MGVEPAREGEARVPQAHIPQARGAPLERVLRRVPQGPSARGAERLQVAAGAGPLRVVPLLCARRARRARLVPARQGRDDLQRVPHARGSERRLRRARPRRQRRAQHPLARVPEREHGHRLRGRHERGRDAGRGAARGASRRDARRDRGGRARRDRRGARRVQREDAAGLSLRGARGRGLSTARCG